MNRIDLEEIADVLNQWLYQTINISKETEPNELINLVLVCISKLPLSREIIRRTRVLILLLITLNMSAE